MKGITKTTRMNSAMQVIQHMNAGMTVVEACRIVGMPRSSFYYLVENNPEAISEIQGIIDANNREQLGLILLSKTEMLRKIIEDGLSDATKPKDRLAIYVKLDELLNGLTDTLRTESKISQDALEVLHGGPILRPAKSRLTATQTTVSYETEN